MKLTVVPFGIAASLLCGCGGGGGFDGDQSPFSGSYIGSYTTDIPENGGTVSGSIDPSGHVRLRIQDNQVGSSSSFDGVVSSDGTFCGTRISGPIHATCTGSVSFHDVELFAEFSSGDAIIVSNVHMVLDRH